MDKERILELSKKENSIHDEMERAVDTKASKIAALVGLLLCSIIMVLETVLADGASVNIWIIFTSILGTEYIVKYIKIRKTSDLIFGIIHIFCAVSFLISFIVGLVL